MHSKRHNKTLTHTHDLHLRNVDLFGRAVSRQELLSFSFILSPLTVPCPSPVLLWSLWRKREKLSSTFTRDLPDYEQIAFRLWMDGWWKRFMSLPPSPPSRPWNCASYHSPHSPIRNTSWFTFKDKPFCRMGRFCFNSWMADGMPWLR